MTYNILSEGPTYKYLVSQREERGKKMSRIVKKIMAENFPVMKRKRVTLSHEILEDEEKFRY